MLSKCQPRTGRCEVYMFLGSTTCFECASKLLSSVLAIVCVCNNLIKVLLNFAFSVLTRMAVDLGRGMYIANTHMLTRGSRIVSVIQNEIHSHRSAVRNGDCNGAATMTTVQTPATVSQPARAHHPGRGRAGLSAIISNYHHGCANAQTRMRARARP